MPHTNETLGTGEQAPAFSVDQKVGVRAVGEIVAPGNTLDAVEEAWLGMVCHDVNQLLRSDLPVSEVGVHENSLHKLGAEAVLEHLPSRAA